MATLKVGIIGCGRIFPMHALPVEQREDLELVAVCDNKEDRAKQAGERHNCAYYTDYKEMLDQEELDAIHICLPHHLHAPVTIEAAKRKIHVLTEKPMSIALEDAEEMIQQAEDHDITLGVIFQNRYNQSSQLVKKMLDEGDLGEVKGAKLYLSWDRSDDYYKASDWKGTWDKEGGGVVIDQAIHTLDLVNWLIDEDIDYIDATIANRAHDFIDVEDTAEGVIKYKNGVVVGFHTVNYYTYDAPVEVEIHCEKGLVKMVGDSAEVLLNDGRKFYAENDPNETFEYDPGVKSYWGVNHIKQINNYYDTLKAGKKPDITGKEAIKTQELVVAIYDSGKKNERVTF